MKEYARFQGSREVEVEVERGRAAKRSIVGLSVITEWSVGYKYR